MTSKRRRPIHPKASLAAIKAINFMTLARRLATTAQAHAWGVLGSATGYVAGSAITQTFKAPLLGKAEFVPLGYAIGVAIYTILSRTFASTDRCLEKAKLYFIAEKITKDEYRRLRARCLQKAGLTGK